MTRQKISCVIACYKDSLAIPVMYQRIKSTFEKIPVEYEIIFVNDSSPDDTITKLKEITKYDDKVLGINHRRNFGSQAAFLSGMRISTGDAVVLMDGDLQDPPELIADFYSKWCENFNVVYGLRAKREVSIWMQFAYKFFYRIFNKVASFKIPVNAGDFSLIDRKSVNEILKFPEYDIFLRALRAYIGGKQTGIPYIRPERMFGRSTNNLFKNIGWATKGILSVSRVPLTLISIFASFLTFTFLVLALVFLGYIYTNENIQIDYFLLLFSCINLFLLLVSLLSIAISGEYIGRILEESKNRPKFIVSNYIYKGEIIEELSSVS